VKPKTPTNSVIQLSGYRSVRGPYFGSTPWAQRKAIKQYRAAEVDEVRKTAGAVIHEFW